MADVNERQSTSMDVNGCLEKTKHVSIKSQLTMAETQVRFVGFCLCMLGCGELWNRPNCLKMLSGLLETDGLKLSYKCMEIVLGMSGELGIV